MTPSKPTPHIAIVGGGPAGLMAAEVAVQGGAQVDLYDAMPSVGRKFLLAGKGGLNLTHGEPLERLLERYGSRREVLEPWLREFGPQQVREWAQGLGVETFVGSSGRVFPTDMKAAPLLRAWLQRLRGAGVRLHMRHRCTGVSAAGAAWQLAMSSPAGASTATADAVVMCLGGASWPQLGSDGSWASWLPSLGATLARLRPANCGFDIGWSPYLRERHAGQPLKLVAIRVRTSDGRNFHQLGECVITETGLEGSLVYAAAHLLRDEIDAQSSALLHLDLLPARTLEWVEAELRRGQGSRSMATHLKTRLGLHGAKAALLHEVLPREAFTDVARLAQAIKGLPLRALSARSVAEAISTAGGVCFESLDDHAMLRASPGVFCAGEMLDWEAPTGGYLLTACLASGRAAARGALAWLASCAQSPDLARDGD